jgi:hypothetical protein
MIFVSYSQVDRQMCDEFMTMAAPLTRYGGVKLWSDADIQPGQDWKKAINKALDETSVAVLLVSKAFLASPFIQTMELPYFINATTKRGVEVMWVLISDCLWKRTPFDPIQAAHPVKKPLDQLSIARQQTAWRKVVENVDEAWQRYERPKINKGLSGHGMNRVEPKLHLLASPARRRAEVFVYSENAKQWWHTGSVMLGQTHGKCYFGDDTTKVGSQFKIVAITTDLLVGGMMPGPPSDRTQSDAVVVKRK